jgi:hypothetical protein
MCVCRYYVTRISLKKHLQNIRVYLGDGVFERCQCQIKFAIKKGKAKLKYILESLYLFLCEKYLITSEILLYT